MHLREPGAGPRLTGPISLLVICKQQAPELEPTSAMPPLPQPPLAPTAPLTPAQGTPSMDELIQQSQWSLQQQEQHLLALRQVQLSPGPLTWGPSQVWGGPVPARPREQEGPCWPHLLGWMRTRTKGVAQGPESQPHLVFPCLPVTQHAWAFATSHRLGTKRGL